jgi:hypothetical protein
MPDDDDEDEDEEEEGNYARMIRKPKHWCQLSIEARDGTGEWHPPNLMFCTICAEEGKKYAEFGKSGATFNAHVE